MILLWCNVFSIIIHALRIMYVVLTVPSLSPHCPLTVPSLSPHCPLTVPSTVPSLSPHRPLTVPSTVPSLSPHRPLTVPSLFPLCSIVVITCTSPGMPSRSTLTSSSPTVSLIMVSQGLNLRITVGNVLQHTWTYNHWSDFISRIDWSISYPSSHARLNL